MDSLLPIRVKISYLCCNEMADSVKTLLEMVMIFVHATLLVCKGHHTEALLTRTIRCEPP